MADDPRTWQPYRYTSDHPRAQAAERGIEFRISGTDLLTDIDAVDLLRVLLADEERAVELIVCAMKRWDSTKYARWRDTSNGQQARLQAADVLAALRKEAGLIPIPTESQPAAGAHTFTVTVSGCTAEQAAQVISERVHFDEDYGFPYRIELTEGPR